jgi:hypothetical protein
MSVIINENEIMCPITKMFYLEPVVASDGYTYEKDIITELIEKNEKSPVTQKTIETTLIPNIKIANITKDFLDKNPDKIIDQYTKVLNHLSYAKKINKIIIEKKFNELLKYKNYDWAIIYYYLCYCENLFFDDKFINFIREIDDDTLKYIIDNSIDVKNINSKCLHDFTKWDSCVDLIHYTIKYSTPEINKYLIDKGVKLRKPIYGYDQVIHLALKYSTPEVIMYIIDQGIDLKCLDLKMQTPIYLAIKYSTLDVIKYMIKKGVDLRYATKGMQPIHYAAKYANPKIIKYVLYHDWDIDLPSMSATDKGWHPIHYAARYNTYETIMYLLGFNIHLDTKIKIYKKRKVDYGIMDLLRLNNKLTDKQVNKLIDCINKKLKN